MGRYLLETIMGAVVLLVAVIFLIFAYSQADLGTVKGYTIKATFSSVGGLANGGDVRINGIKVGTVTSQEIDPKTFLADVTMSIRTDIRLPVDTAATIDSDGLLGGKYVSLLPGKSGDSIAPGGSIARTHNYRSLEEMVGDIIFLATDNGKSSAGAPVAGTGSDGK